MEMTLVESVFFLSSDLELDLDSLQPSASMLASTNGPLYPMLTEAQAFISFVEAEET